MNALRLGVAASLLVASLLIFGCSPRQPTWVTARASLDDEIAVLDAVCRSDPTKPIDWEACTASGAEYVWIYRGADDASYTLLERRLVYFKTGWRCDKYGIWPWEVRCGPTVRTYGGAPACGGNPCKPSTGAHCAATALTNYGCGHLADLRLRAGAKSH